MVPKQSLKRRQEDEKSPGPNAGRKTKKMGKNKREVTYETYDEAMDGGVDMEEKGERYRDGDKAQRFYEKALDLYKKAYDFSPTFDAAYNQARVLFTLATLFNLPPTSLSYLTTSINLYRHAITLTQEVLLSLDAGYNLAQALLELAEVLEDLHSDRDEEVRDLRVEAVGLLSQIMDGQARFLRDRTPDQESKLDIGDAQEPEPDGDKDMDVDGDGEDAGGPENNYETYLPTPSTFIDTCLLALDTHLTLWTSLDPPAIPSAEDQTVVRAVLDRAAALGVKGKQAETDLGEVKVLLALDEIVWRMHKSEAQPETGATQQCLEKATVALGSLLTSLDLNPPDEPTLRADILTTRAEVEETIALRLVYLSRQGPAGPSQLGQGAWYHLGESITHLNNALELPTSASTPRTFKPSVLLSLSEASLARARTARINDTAKRNAPQLVENALNYGVKAAESIGWNWVNPSRLEMSAKAVHPNRVELPWASGWDAEVLARSVVLQLLRTAFFAVNEEELDLSVDVKQRYEVLAKGIMDRVTASEGERRILPRDIVRLIDDLEDGEGVLTQREKEWWERIASELI